MSYLKYLESKLDALSRFIERKKVRPILFIGSGFSRRYINSPTWKDLLEKLATQSGIELEYGLDYYIEEYHGNLSEVANVLEEPYRRKYWKNKEQYPEELFQKQNKSIYLKHQTCQIIDRYLQEDFEEDIDETLKTELELFKKLTPQSIITTNYDELLEYLLPNYTSLVGQEALRSSTTTNAFKILKIHGCVSNPSSIVLNSNDYEDFSKKQLYITAKLLTYFIEYPIIFIGYNLDDPNIRDILKSIHTINDYNSDYLLDNMWFVEWDTKASKKSSFVDQKTIPLNDGGNSVRMNYICLENYTKLFDALYQESVDPEFLRAIEDKVYKLIRSDSITNMPVSVMGIQGLKDEQYLLEKLASERMYVKLGEFTKPEELSMRFPHTPTDAALLAGCDTWQSLYHEVIAKIKEETGKDIKATNNDYHVKISGGVTRYSQEAISLFKKYKEGKPYKEELLKNMK